MDGGGRLIFDLNTVKMIEPGRFSLTERRIDELDIMRLRLKVLTTLQRYCERADGTYPAPTDFLTLGAPNLPVKNIEVGRGLVTWPYPYKRLGPTAAAVHCKSSDPARSEIDLFLDDISPIINGFPSNVLYDCNKGLSGTLVTENDDPTNTQTSSVQKDARVFANYVVACRAVMHEQPYIPQSGN
jgi:hypothetical protein